MAKKPKNKEIDPELEKTFDKLGIPLEERLALSGTAVDAIIQDAVTKNVLMLGFMNQEAYDKTIATGTSTLNTSFAGRNARILLSILNFPST